MGVYDSVVITGGGGMLAHALAARLRARGIEPTLATRAQCDISQREQVRQLFEHHRPTLLLNCAAHTQVDACEHDAPNAFAINRDGPLFLAESARDYRTKFIHFSTDFVFDGQSDRPYLTSDAPNPLSVYGESKFSGEKQVREIAPEGWMIVRTAWLYGGHGHCFPKTILKVARSGSSLAVVDDQFGTPTLTTDLAAVTLKMVDVRAQGMFHVTNDGKTTWYQFAKKLLEVFRVSAELRPVTTTEWIHMRPKQARRPRYSVLDCSKAIEIIGTPMREWPDALIDFRDAEQAAGT